MHEFLSLPTFEQCLDDLNEDNSNNFFVNGINCNLGRFSAVER